MSKFIRDELETSYNESGCSDKSDKKMCKDLIMNQ